jgi:agmatinase
MTGGELKRLRHLYGAEDQPAFHDPHFAAVAAQQFRGARRKLPYAEPSTFLGAPYCPAPDAAALAGLDVALVGVPYDLGTTNRTGARFGPRAVRGVERVGPYDHVLRRAPAGRLRLADIGDVPFASRFQADRAHDDIFDFYSRLRAARVLPLSVGGDHSISHPILRALGAMAPVGLIHIDAHCDTGGPFEGNTRHHGTPFRMAVLDGVLDPKRTVQIGIRGGVAYLWEFSAASGMTVLSIEAALEMGMPKVAALARAIVGDGPTYVSFDIDSIDPALAPGTGTPEVGGFAPREVLALLRGLAGINLIGADVVEVAPQYDTTTGTAQIAAQMLFTLSCLADIALEKAAA